jgi:hypothetical protein
VKRVEILTSRTQASATSSFTSTCRTRFGFFRLTAHRQIRAHSGISAHETAITG